MEGKTRTEDGRYNHPVVDGLDGGFAQRRLDHARNIFERLRNLIGRHLADAFQIAAEAHRILLDGLVADLRDEFVENRVLFA